MIRIYTLLSMLALAAAHVAAQSVQFEPPFAPQFPQSSAVGNALVASSTGFESLYTNPAGFARGKPSITLATASPGLLAPPTRTSVGLLGEAWRSPSTAGQLLGPIFDEGGFGGTAALGLGYTGSGLGLGLLMDAQAWGATPADMSAQATFAFVGGMAINVNDHLTIGGDVRPMFRVHVPQTQIGDLISFLQSPTTAGQNISALYGVGVGLDVGAIATYGSFSYGLAINDIGGTTFYYASDSLGAVAASLGAGDGLPPGQGVTDTYVIPMRATLGVAYHPSLGGRARFFDPRLEVDYTYRFVPNSQTGGDLATTLLDGLRAGAEIGVLSYLHLRAGYAFGHVSFGVGMDLPGFQVDARAFQRVAPTTQAGPNEGVSAGISIRF